MKRVKVPVDTSSEQKVLLGIISMRQLIYLGTGVFLIYSVTPLIWNLPFSLIAKVIMHIIFAIPILLVVSVLGFVKKQKYSMFFDMYIITRLQEKSQYGTWRKGTKPKEWM